MMKTLLALSLVCLGAGIVLNSGLVNTHDIDALYAVLPTGAVLAGLYLIGKLLEKESAAYDQEQAEQALALAAAPAPAPARDVLVEAR
jgi:hypothetical protein